ncbi:MAG: PilW family protein [Candidatus Sedimenticola sp. (ex Thyasira tokunagai)]
MKFFECRQKGFSLVELMIAMVIALILSAAIIQVFGQMNQGFLELIKGSRQLENGRYAITILNEDIRHAGFYGEAYVLPAIPGSTPNPCETDSTSVENALPIAIQSLDDSETIPTSWDCFSNRDSGSDILIVRRVSTTAETAADLDSGKAYLQSQSSTMIFDEASPSETQNLITFNLLKKDAVTPAEIRRFLVHAYYVATCRDCSGSGDGIPTLRRLELSDLDSTMTNTTLVDGIESFQIDIGLDTSGNGNLDLKNPAAPSEGWATLPSSTNSSQWENTVTVGINLIARNIKLSAGYSDDKTYTQGQAETTDFDPSGSAENFKRHAFNSVTRVVNVSGRRESP